MVAELLRAAEAQGVRVYQRSGKLHFFARRGAMTDELLHLLKANKEQILGHLSMEQLNSGRSLTSRSSEAGPLSCAQERIWLLDRLEGGSAAYNMPAAYRVSGALDVSALRACFGALIERHAVLRTNVVERDGTLAQHVRSEPRVALAELDISHLPHPWVDEEVARLRAQEAQLPFDLTSDPPLRVTLISLSAVEHVLLVTLHHIACDGWSIGMLVSELGRLYEAVARGQELALPAAKLQYLDYARWQRSWLAGPQAQHQLEYWTQRLQNLPLLHGLALDASRTRVGKGLGAIHDQLVNRSLQRTVDESSRRSGTTPFMFLQAAFVALLGRYGNETDIVIGTPVAGRVHLETEGLIGNFVNTLVLRTNLADSPHFTELLQRTKNSVLEALQNQQLPFEKLVEHVARERPQNANPVFQIMFALHEFENSNLEFSKLEVTRLEQAPTEAKLDLELHVIRGQDEQLLFRWVYNADLFKPQTIRSLANAYGTLIEQVAREPHTAVQELALCSAAQCAELLADATGPERELGTAATHRLFEQQVQKTPDAVAAEFEGECVSYQHLDQRANRLAQRLIAAGVAPGDLIGICVRRGLDLLAGLLAIWKAGAAYVPLDPDQPRARVEEILSDANITLILTQEAVSQRLQDFEIGLIHVDHAGPDGQCSAPERPRSPDDPAYVLYTSGSTGRPKGAVISHRGLVNYLDHATRSYLRQEVVGSVVSSPLSFDATITTLFTPLLVGARVKLLPDGDNAVVLSRLGVELFGRKESWLFKITPAHLDVLAAQAADPNADARHVIVIGGEQLTGHTLAAWRTQLLPRSTFINEYGPTETVVGCSVYELNPGHDPEASQEGAIPIGRPIQNTELHVLSPNNSHVGEGALQPTGAKGELYIGGAGVARGYLNRDQLSAERFVPNPFSKTSGSRLYRTGDLVRRRADGELEFLGRIDHQLKLRGYRIEPGELEARLRSLAAVRDAVVHIRRDATDENYLTVYVTGHQTAEPHREAELVAECRAHLKQSVPDYMVPDAFVYLRELPLTANGKLDRKALPVPDGDAFRRAVYVAPRDEREQRLCQLWAEVLGIERISTDDDFFQLGGHSLGATRLVGLVRSRLDTDVSLRDVFEQPNVRAFAIMLSARAKSAAPSPKSLVELGHTGPLSFAQQRLRFIDQFEDEGAHYSLFGGFHLSGRLDRRALWRAVNELIARHESLRTVFPRLEGDSERQVVRADWGTPIVELDLSAVEVAELDEHVARVVRDEAARRFDLTQDAMLRVTLLTCSAERWLMLVNIHHIAADGWSIGVLLDDFSRLYSGHARNLEVELPATSLRYLEFADQQRQAHRQGRFDRELSYWKTQLADLPPVHSLPLRGPRPSTQSHAGASHAEPLSAELTTALHEFCRERNVTLFMALQTAFAVLVARYGNTTDIVIGTAISGREYPGSEHTVGLFVNMLALRSNIAENPTFVALLTANKATILDAYEHQGVPFDVLVEKIRPERNLSYDPLVQLVLTFQNNQPSQLDLAGLTVEALRIEETQVKFDLHLDVQVVRDQLELRWLYKTELFEHAFVRRMASNFETLLRGIVANPQKPILQLPLLHEAERERLLAPAHNAGTHCTPHGCLHEYFEAQAQRHPTRIAVRHGSRHWSYDELNQLSNRLAHYLIQNGVGPESLVGLCVEPAIDTLVGILGILKAGGAYVPIGPDQPERRISYILRDAAVEIVLTQSTLVEKLQLDNLTLVCLDSADYQAKSCGLSIKNPTSSGARPRAENAAYIIYTSGSTGEPKGVCVEHSNVLSLLGSANEHFRFNEDDVWTLFHSAAFDFSVWEIWGALFHGGCVVVVPVATTKDPERLSLLLQNERVTVLNQTPQAFYALQEAMIRTACRHRLRYVVFGGEALDYTKLRRWYDAYATQTTLVNMYGITETTVHVTFAPIEATDVDATRSGIGRPLSSLFGVVCNACQELQPIGCAGELLVAGAGVARGYLNRPELSEQRFLVLNQYGDERFYRTGDLVRTSEVGTLDYLGRIDGQIKIRGFRIEPGEIEKHLSALDSIRHCVVVAREDALHGKTLIAYVVPRINAAESGLQYEEHIAACRDHLQARLPSYMVPSTFILLSALPTTTNGKVDYRALPAVDAHTLRPARNIQPPRSKLESNLVAAWKEVLGLESVSIDDNFFESGGHSLATITLTTLLKRQFQLDIPVAELFRHQTIRSLSDALGSGGLQRENLALLLKVHGAKPPLFFLPPATGVGHCFMALSASLPSDRAHYAFMTPGQETGTELPESVESLARRYLDYIRTYHGVLPHWYLAGYSVGGVVAYEIGRQCIASGYPTPHLIMLDSYLPRHKPLVPLRPAQILYDVYGDDASQYLTTAKHLVKLFFEYRPHPAPLSVTVFKATGSSPLIYSNRRNWRYFALAGVDVVPVPGEHRTLLAAENLPTLAQAFERCFEANDQKQR